MKYDYLIVGSGLFGATFAHMAAVNGEKCLVVENRNYVGGNVYCENVEGIDVHKYGAHIFHTDNRAIWEFVNTFDEFNRYTNSPLAFYKDKLYNLPFNMNTFHQLWGVSEPRKAREIIDRQRSEFLEKLGGREPENLEEQALSLVGKDIFEKLIKGYTEKQWGRDCKDLPAFIIKRLPLRFTYDNNYFNDMYQGIPKHGYNRIVLNLLKDACVILGVDFFEMYGDTWRNKAKKLVYTGPIDRYFGYSEGRLDWRTVRFVTRVLDMPNFQGNAVVNYTSRELPYTRVIEHKHFTAFGDEVYKNPRTVVSEEYSTEFKPGMEPYYPVNDSRNERLLRLYNGLVAEEKDVIFGGRLAEYKYYDMDKVIMSAMNCYNNQKR